jgi:hypothetical protein
MEPSHPRFDSATIHVVAGTPETDPAPPSLMRNTTRATTVSATSRGTG